MLISQQARAGIPVNHDFHPERVPNHQEWSSYSTTVTLSSSERQEHMFLLKRPDHMRCGHASIPRFPTLVGMLYYLGFASRYCSGGPPRLYVVECRTASQSKSVKPSGVRGM